MKFGPSRPELWFRLLVSLAGLGLMAVAIAIHGWPEGPGLIEVVGFGGLFFGGTAVLSVLRLIRQP
jgi:hypothetical protein